MTDVLTEICNIISRIEEWPTPWTQSLIITSLPKKGNLQLCQKYGAIMLKVVLNRLNHQVEEVITEEKAGFRAGKSTTMTDSIEKLKREEGCLCYYYQTT